jgi:hypothetical protein
MSRFTEHFDMNIDQLVHPSSISSPSKVSFGSYSSSGSSSQLNVNSVLLSHYNSYENSSQISLSEPNDQSEKRYSGKFKRLLSTMSKKKLRLMSNNS